MNRKPPNARELMRMPLRAIAEYALRSARRVATVLSDGSSDDTVNAVLDQIGTIVRAGDLGAADASSLMHAVAALTDVVSKRPQFQMADGLAAYSCISRAAFVAIELVQAEREPQRVAYHIERAAQQAEKAVCRVSKLSVDGGPAASAAHEDYSSLISKYGARDILVIGDPVDY